MKLPTLIPMSILSLLLSCKKENASEVHTSSIKSRDNETVFVEKTAAITKLTLRPNSKNGQDVYVAKIDNDPNDGNTNCDNRPELCMARWTVTTGGSATWRSFIRFDNLIQIPKTSTVLSAKLYLYGVSSSESFPPGNSYYPGSSYQENPCIVQRVTGWNWNEQTLTWNMQPTTTTVDQGTIHVSTSQWNYDEVVNVTDIVKEMVLHPNKNYGFCIKLKDETVMFQSMIFGTSEVSDKTRRPKLVVEYE